MRPVLLAVKISVVFLVVMWAFAVATVYFMFEIVVRHIDHHARIAREAHDDFVTVVLLLGLVATALMAAFSVWITTPLRRMSRSMDRVAAGDLEHRVRVRGRDEGAAMARSFNAMADRVRAMIVGQKELMAGVSHELRSPLARMKLSLALLGRGQGGEARIADLEAEVDAIDALVGELLLASRLDLQAVPIEPVELDLADVCREGWSRVADEAAAAGATLELALAGQARRVMADRALTVRILGNLFENAVRHAGRGRVTVSSRPAGDRVRLAVADEGPGVERADLDRLFEPFFRADRSRSHRTGAGGLGLMIVRRAVEAHGGTVRAELAAPRGLVVTFDLAAGVDEAEG
jgi:signal transduction histidine kinase